jgi:lysozyme
MTAIIPKMQEQERRHLWSLRWLIVGAFVQGGAVLYLALGADGRAHVPDWAFYAWGVLALFVAALAAIGKAMQPKGGVLNLPLGPAVAPRMPSWRPTLVPGRPGNAPEDAPAPPAGPRPRGFSAGPAVRAARAAVGLAGNYTPHPSTPTSPNDPDTGSGGDIPPPPDPDTTPIPVPAPPAPPEPAPTAFMWGSVGATPQITAERLAAYSEGLRTTAYQDSGGVWTIGYGHTADVKAGDTCTEQQATDWLTSDMAWAFDELARVVTVPCTDNQQAALADFVFNLGSGNFESSTLLRKLNAGDYDGAADEFPKWVYCDGVVLQGLVIRRDNEQQLFLTS